jgi:uncharacterized protein (TIGR03067 family)
MTLTRPIGLALAASAVATALALLHHRFLPEAAERIDLHGTWRIVSRESGGQPVPVAPGEMVVIDGIAMTWSFTKAQPSDSQAPFRLSARTTPPRMDIRFQFQKGSVPANGWDGVTRAVYERDSSTLQLGWYSNDVTNPDPNRRPAQFPEVPTPYTIKLVLKR